MRKEEEKVLLEAVVVYLLKEDEVLLAYKTEKIGKGCFNGYGGGVEPGETLAAAAVRETKQESGVEILPQDLEKVAIMDFYNNKTDGETFTCRVHFYFARKWIGEPGETEEGIMIDPTWFPFSALPKNIMRADAFFLPVILSGKKIIGKAVYTPFQKELIGEVEIKEVENFND